MSAEEATSRLPIYKVTWSRRNSHEVEVRAGNELEALAKASRIMEKSDPKFKEEADKVEVVLHLVPIRA